jgi:hypothetical protein
MFFTLSRTGNTRIHKAFLGYNSETIVNVEPKSIYQYHHSSSVRSLHVLISSENTF